MKTTVSVGQTIKWEIDEDEKGTNVVEMIRRVDENGDTVEYLETVSVESWDTTIIIDIDHKYLYPCQIVGGC